MKREIIFSVLIGIPVLVCAQTAARRSYMQTAAIEHTPTGVRLTANDSTPLMQAIEAIDLEYGWIVDYEDPNYRSKFDLIDVTDTAWRADHPNEPGALSVAGGAFHSEFPEPNSIAGADAEKQVLEMIVADYNASGNPGKFVVRKEPDGRYAVIGASRRNDAGADETAAAPLDIRISFPVQKRAARETLQLIVDSVTASSGTNMYFATGFSANPLYMTEVTVGGSHVAARELLIQTLEQITKNSPLSHGITFVYELGFNPTGNIYWLNLRAATKKDAEANGK